MSNSKFFHYRNAFKSDHLASADVEELQENNKGVAILTIDKIEYQENRSVAGRKVPKCLVAFFLEKNTKPMVVNAGNSKVIRSFIGSSNVYDWVDLNLKIELYVDSSVKMKGQIVGGIKIRPSIPEITLPPVNIEEGLKWLIKGNTIKKLRVHRVVTKSQETELLNLFKSSQDANK